MRWDGKHLSPDRRRRAVVVMQDRFRVVQHRDCWLISGSDWMVGASITSGVSSSVGAPFRFGAPLQIALELGLVCLLLPFCPWKPLAGTRRYRRDLRHWPCCWAYSSLMSLAARQSPLPQLPRLYLHGQLTSLVPMCDWALATTGPKAAASATKTAAASSPQLSLAAARAITASPWAAVATLIHPPWRMSPWVIALIVGCGQKHC